MKKTRKNIRPIYVGSTDALQVTGSQRSRRVTRKIKVGGLIRTYRIFYPPGFDATKPTPIIVAYHGGGGSSSSLSVVSGLHKRAGTNRFVVAYPDGFENSWNTGDGWGGACEKNIDDIAFSEEVLADMESMFLVDKSRIFLVGFSNGGKFVYKLACGFADRVAAIAVVASSLDEWEETPSRPIPLMHIHGTNDQMSPFSGGFGVGQARTRRQTGVPSTIAKWLDWNGLSDHSPVIKIGNKATSLIYSSKEVMADVVLHIVEGLGHQWPAGDVILGLGPGVEDLSATDLIIEFFLAHPLVEKVQRLTIE